MESVRTVLDCIFFLNFLCDLIDRRSYFAGRLEEGGTADLSVQDLFHDVVRVLLPGLAGLDQAMGLGPGGLGVT